VRLYETLFTHEDPGENDELNPNSLEVLKGCRLEPALGNVALADRIQFERLGYFCLDPDSMPGSPVFNRTVALKDAWARIEKRGKAN
jgi:glutaminyl-tRNA synthetase